MYLSNTVFFKKFTKYYLLLSTDHHVVVELAPVVGKDASQTWQGQTYCEVLLETPGRVSYQSFNSYLRKNFNHDLGEVGDFESEWIMFHASIVEAAD